MLSAFTARPIIELKQRDKSKIETILAYGDRVLVGLNSGSLRIYRLNELPSNQPQPPSSPANGADPPASPSDRFRRVDSKSGGKPRPSDLLREVEKFSTRAIEQLAIIKEANTLISLSNNHVSLHDLQTYQLTETLARTKNATCFAVTSNIVKDAATGIPEIISRLAVAVKRRLLVWSWHESELHDDVTEILLPEAIRTVTWANATKLVCGLNAGYVLVDVTTAETTEITGTSSAVAGQGSRFGAASMGYIGLGGYVPKPLAARLTDGQMLLARDINTLFIDVNANGKPLEKRQIPWQAAPETIGYSYPYILALQNPAKGSLEVRNPDTLSLLQVMELPGAANMHFPPPTVSLAHAAKGFHVSSERAVWKMDATDYDTQVQELIDQSKFDEAISVLKMLEDALLRDKTGTLREVKMRKAETLFRQRKFRESLDLFNEDEVHAPPERVLRLYPPIIAGELSEGPVGEDTLQGEEELEEEEPKTGTNGDKAAKAPGARATTPEAASPAKAGGFVRYWMGHRKTDSDAASIASSKKGSTDNDDAVSVKPKVEGKKKVKDNRVLEGEDLVKAVRELNSYLAGTRARLQRVIDPSTGKLKPRKQQTSDATQSSTTSDDIQHHIDDLLGNSQSESDELLEKQLRDTFTLVDTTLFRGYMFSQPSLIGSLLRIANFCDPDVVKEKLLEKNRYNELVDFFHGKRLHREALELLRRFGEATDETADADGVEPAERQKSGDGEEIEGPTGKDGDATDMAKDERSKRTQDILVDPKKIPDQLRGPRRTVAYLQSLPPDLIDLVLEFARWVLRRDPDLGMQVFVADTENAETLPRDRVLEYLGEIDVDLKIRYLDHVIDEWEDATPDFHNLFAELLIGALKGAADAAGGDDEKTDGRERERGRGSPVWNERMDKLVRFLRKSRQYSLGKAYGLIPRDDPAFYEALAVVYSNMGQHKQALEIYVFKIQDYAKAEDYCNRVYKSGDTTSPAPSLPQIPETAGTDQDDPDATPSIYHTLLSLYLTPPSPHKPNLEPALSLLSRHGSRLPAASTLSLIPDDLPVADLTSYFRGRIRAANSAVAESRVVEGLRRTQLVNMQALLLLGDGVPGGQGGRNRRVLISEERVCGVCHKRLGNSVIAVRPDNSVVHYGCQARGRSTSGTHGSIAGAWGRQGSLV
ncbi:hypothetical protein DL771_003005 [Monosporascus sp. 5C6A]|nr:hypothetical protein DL771_003005 [Monosporascus sp. 5C6A]